MMTQKQQEIINKVREARDFLTDQGYYVGNLWMTLDVLNYELEDGSIPDLTEDEAMWVLDKVLSSEWLTEQVFVSIREHIELLKSKSFEGTKKSINNK
jgi:hypothetical protein